MFWVHFMKNIFLLIMSAAAGVLLWACDNEVAIKRDDNYSSPIQRQKASERKYVENGFTLLRKVNLASTVYYPLFLVLDSDNTIYLLDRSTGFIHKFSIQDSEHVVFGNGKGQGPGELMEPQDIDVYLSKIYIADPPNGSLKIYSTNGTYLTDLTLNLQKLIPRKVVAMDHRLLIEPYTSQGVPFYYFDSSGTLISHFGDYIDQRSLGNGVYHDNDILRLSDSRFAHFPTYLGFAAFYDNDSLLFCKETIDGLKSPVSYNNMVIGEGITVNKIEKTFYTASMIASNKKNILVQAYDIKKRKLYYDMYKSDNFDYEFTLSGLPVLEYFDMNDSFFAGVRDSTLYMWKM